MTSAERIHLFQELVWAMQDGYAGNAEHYHTGLCKWAWKHGRRQALRDARGMRERCDLLAARLGTGELDLERLGWKMPGAFRRFRVGEIIPGVERMYDFEAPITRPRARRRWILRWLLPWTWRRWYKVVRVPDPFVYQVRPWNSKDGPPFLIGHPVTLKRLRKLEKKRARIATKGRLEPEKGSIKH